ncbi:MAG TPA: bifunctional diguanylate cyclase/phosphodiesterase, partial [Spongiibacteraceae bacterium]|nr:bifunctional diguanylate cyclase/phosphodiesterase [Spongiibacteraceae bacterium]
NSILKDMAARFDRLDAALSLLLRHQIKLYKSDDADLKRVMIETNRTTRELQSARNEKELFEHHSKLLEKVVLSHEKILHWKPHAREILNEFGKILAFDYLFIAFIEGDELSLTLFSLRPCLVNTESNAAKNLCRRLVEEIGLPESTPVVIEQYIADPGNMSAIEECPENVQIVTTAIPNLDDSNSRGILGVGFSNEDRANDQHLTLLRSMMSVMVMVVGSSKALSHTFAELEYHSSHDALTGLYNRRAFTEILNDEIARSERHSHSLSLLMIDLDDFKDINDTFGHLCGDLVLKTVAEILRSTIRQGDFATRIGGDEFTILLTETHTEGAHRVAEKLRNKIRSHVFESSDGKKFQITTSIGIVTYPDNALTAIDLMAGVDIGLYQAKAEGKDGVAYSDSMSELLHINRNARAFVEQVRESLNEGRIIAHYQPIFDCRSGRLYAHETLARMIDTSGKILTAGAFIETIEKYGLARELDHTIIKQSITELAKRDNMQSKLHRLFINLSAQEIQNRDVLSYAEKLCKQLHVSPDAIVFEILERDAIGDIMRMRKFLDKLRQKGFLFALDDFGSGYNSFHYLRELKFDYVKIDGTFVKNIQHSNIDLALVRNLTRLCQDIGIKTVAEFVESAEVLISLQQIGVDYVQGYYLGEPAAEMQSSDTRGSISARPSPPRIIS